MKAFLLAAGLGSRLSPLTDRTPKCLLPVDGKPMLEIWLDHLRRGGVDEVLVNTHHLREQVEAFAQKWRGSPRLKLAHEPSLLGSAGTLRENRAFVRGEDSFLVIYADNLTRFKVSQLSGLLAARRAEHPLGVMALFRSPEPSRCGIARLDDGGWVRAFEEKPKQPASNLANAGLYAFTAEALESLPGGTPSDIGHDFIPRLVPRLIGLEMDEPFIDIGTLASYRQASETTGMF